MCVECNCLGTVTPYGVGGRAVGSAPAPAHPELYNKPIIRIGETPYGMKAEMEDDDDMEDMGS